MMRLAPLLLILTVLAAARAQTFAPDGRVRPDDRTAFMAVDARLSDGLTPFQPGGQNKFYVQGWTRPDQRAEWTLRVEEAGEYEVCVSMRRNAGRALRVAISAGGSTHSGTLAAEAPRAWDRLPLTGTLALPAGASTLTLRLASEDGVTAFDACVHAVELVRPAVRAEQARRALALRADPAWFQKARYGIMVHWTNESAPLHGEPKPYAAAVEAFDVEAFAERVQRTGAGFVVFTTAHAYQYFPAPLASLDKLLPGRTSRRDLVADLADALGRRGLKLMLYYHLGAVNDVAWMRASGCLGADAEAFFTHWRAIISEAGNRYGGKLAGWWFDEGATSYYYRNAPWESLARAAKAGNPQRLVGFNAWELVNPTGFHDFCTGEGCQEPRGFGGLLRPGGDGRYPCGTHAGLQASACLTTERDWGHFSRDAPFPPPKWSAPQLAELLRGFITCRNVPIFNLEIAQDGQLSARTLALFEEAGQPRPSQKNPFQPRTHNPPTPATNQLPYRLVSRTPNS